MSEAAGQGRVIVAGGGLAGLACACRLADAGLRPLLLEKRPFLGGRAYSYTDGRTGLEVDNGQHVFLGCCTEYIAFLRRLKVYAQTYLQPALRLRVIDKLTGVSELRADPLPPPLHLMPSFLAYRPLSPLEKAQAAYALARIRAIDRRQRRDLDGVSFGEWLRAHRQSENSIRNFWDLVILPTLNDSASNVSTDMALMVLQEGFLRSRTGSAIGYARVGLTKLLGEAATRYIQERGGEVRLGEAVRGIVLTDGIVRGVRTGGEVLEADGYVLAMPPAAMLEMLPPALAAHSFFAGAARIEYAPIVNIHLWYDRPVTAIPFAAFLNTPVQWVFNKSLLWGSAGPEQYLDISLSGAYDFIDMPGQELLALFTAEMRALFPLARNAELRNSLVVKQPQATFSPRPGIAGLRPGPASPIPNLFLAGDWTATGWPATMESAVRSGLLAARAAVNSISKGGDWRFSNAVASALRN